ncbi:K+-transporting ATPase ATPase A chain [Aureimonas altamirensis DSM 21988]|uniref:Potassium-transporting ATPase potassium-binding subunit n=2 Tax=Aureimonas altamirensis TaxID=370622 RepID=A0A0P0YXR0_9HYPH|nr:potassium-transporting ATPase subunit KdpA [Aureimonas altamirensis]BAT26269.1 potassium-transporting ATPase subunit alpha [Aureimonas altamirensis]SHJ42686.1 K+-transporting ATPase ATPase A chain [Aureimonas altamirensis DSM 21988]
MTLVGWAQIIAILALCVISALVLGRSMARVFAGERTFMSPIIAPVEGVIHRMAGIDPAKEQGWLAFALSMIAFNLVGFVALYALLRLQGVLPFNQSLFPGLDPDLAFNTAVSFVTNTNWQSYSGEATMSDLSQMAGLTVQNFLSAATGIALALALVRSFARGSVPTVGNFYVDVIRAVLYVLLPLAIVTAAAQIYLGTPQTLVGSVSATTLEGGTQVIARGPVASQLAIKQLGTNGGGFFNANAAHPFENPSPLTNVLTIWQMLVVSLGLVFAFGRMIDDKRQARVLVGVMGFLLFAGIGIAYYAESAGTPMLAAAGLDPAGGNMEGKEVRFGIAASALFAAVTTGLSDGAVNAMHDSFTPIGGMVPMALIMLGEILPGGVGSGLYGMLVMAIIAVFIAGLMVGRTPEYLGKKIDAGDMKLAVLAIIVLPATMLGFAALAAVTPTALATLNNGGPHGLSEIYYAYASAAGNNGSAFAGLGADNTWWNTTLALAMLLGRFAYVVPVIAMAGRLAAKPRLAPSAGTFPTHGLLFAGLLAGVILILGGLQFFPALALGPIAEQVQMSAGKTF